MELKIIYRDPKELIPYGNNARTHTDAEVDELIELIKETGFNDPIGIDNADGIIEGHRRQRAALKMGLTQVPTINLSHLSPNQKRAYILAHNKIAENAGWDLAILAEEMNALTLEEFDTSILGWDEDEVGKILKDADFLPNTPPVDNNTTTNENEGKTKRTRQKSKILHTCPNCNHEFTA